MQSWPDRRVLDLLGIEVPIIQAPMAGADSVALALAVCKAGGLGSLGCALRTPDEIRAAVHMLDAGFLPDAALPFPYAGALVAPLAVHPKRLARPIACRCGPARRQRSPSPWAQRN